MTEVMAKCTPLPGSTKVYFQISHGIHFVQMEVGDEISKRNEVGVLVRAKEREGAITLSWLEKILSSIQMQKE